MMIVRPNRVGNTHSCRRWPACPNGASNVKPSPVPKPSSEIEKLWTRTWDMATSEALGVCDINWLTLTPNEARPPVPEEAPSPGDAPNSCQALFVRTADRTVMSHSGEDMLLSGHAFTER